LCAQGGPDLELECHDLRILGIQTPPKTQVLGEPVRTAAIRWVNGVHPPNASAPRLADQAVHEGTADAHVLPDRVDSHRSIATAAIRVRAKPRHANFNVLFVPTYETDQAYLDPRFDMSQRSGGCTVLANQSYKAESTAWLWKAGQKFGFAIKVRRSDRPDQQLVPVGQQLSAGQWCA
jgi:hypothetical protein